MTRSQEKLLAASLLRTEQARAFPGTRVIEVKDLRAGDRVLSATYGRERVVARTTPARAAGYTFVFFTDGTETGTNCTATWTIAL